MPDERAMLHAGWPLPRDALPAFIQVTQFGHTCNSLKTPDSDVLASRRGSVDKVPRFARKEGISVTSVVTTDRSLPLAWLPPKPR